MKFDNFSDYDTAGYDSELNYEGKHRNRFTLAQKHTKKFCLQCERPIKGNDKFCNGNCHKMYNKANQLPHGFMNK